MENPIREFLNMEHDWLVEASLRDKFSDILSGSPTDLCELQATYEAHIKAKAADTEHTDGNTATVVDGNAIVPIHGLLTEAPHFFAMYTIGNTLYGDIIAQVQAADIDPNVKKITLLVDSPGGNTRGMFAAIDAIARTKTDVTAEVVGMAASAAFGLASQANTIVAQTRDTFVGSIGTAIQVRTGSGVVTVTNTDSPKKAPDVETTQGRADIVAMLDAVNIPFVDAIAHGRGVSVDTVKNDFGQGAVMIAADALKAGMIDSIAGARNMAEVTGKTNPGVTAVTHIEHSDTSNATNIEVETVSNSETVQTQELKPMDINELKAAHPSLFSEVVALGTAKEQKRVSAHLKMGDSTGATDIAHKAISDGTPFGDDEVQAEYLSAGISHGMQKAREDENAETETDTVNSDTNTDTEAKHDAAILASVALDLGIAPVATPAEVK